jgi:hypothetical protein
MSDDSNPLGGKNPHSLYVPMSETEQEFVTRLAEAGDLQVRVHGWGVVPNPQVIVGDLQVVIPMTLRFDRPEVPVLVHSFDLELLTTSGVSLYREKQSTEYGGQPIMVGQGTEIQMVWHIGIKAMDPKLVKAYLPGAKGLTSRVIDKDTGDITLTGNMHLDTEKKRLIALVRNGEDSVRAERDAKTSPKPSR